MFRDGVMLDEMFAHDCRRESPNPLRHLTDHLDTRRLRKTTYRPNRPDTRFRTNYALMSQWMSHAGSRKAKPLSHEEVITFKSPQTLPEKHSAGNVYGRRSRMVNSYGAPSPYRDDNLPDGAQLASVDEDLPLHTRYAQNAGYDDFHRSFRQVSQQWPNKSFPLFGPPRLRHGRAGGSWRHVKEVLQAGGNRIVFVDGQIAYEDSIKIDDVPKGHLILPDARAPGSRPRSRPLSRSLSLREGNQPNMINIHELLKVNSPTLRRARRDDSARTAGYHVWGGYKARIGAGQLGSYTVEGWSPPPNP